jgi:hypothetical protein
VSQTVTRIIALLAVALAALAGFAQARTGARRPGAHAAACHVRVSRIARGQGSPDDLVWDARTLLVSDINSGRIGALVHGHLRTLVSHLRDPEGIVPGPGHSLIVAEQATNRVLEINLANGSRSTLAKLPLPAGKSGVDGINADGPGAVYIPDSARGRLYVLHLRPRKLSLVARGMNRPVAALNWGHATVVADEYASAIWRIGPKRTRTRLATVPLPDDLAVVSGHLIAVSLGGEVWEAAPHTRLLSSAFAPTASDPQGLVADGPDAALAADESRNGIYRVSRLTCCL